ncbi:hypothetical protein SK128_021811, partial [Halocaridina rubra]
NVTKVNKFHAGKTSRHLEQDNDQTFRRVMLMKPFMKEGRLDRNDTSVMITIFEGKQRGVDGVQESVSGNAAIIDSPLKARSALGQKDITSSRYHLPLTGIKAPTGQTQSS